MYIVMFIEPACTQEIASKESGDVTTQTYRFEERVIVWLTLIPRSDEILRYMFIFNGSGIVSGIKCSCSKFYGIDSMG